MIGQDLGHYKILDKLGEGGMGEVYRAEDTTLKRHVALKVLPADFASSQERLERFQREAQVLAALNHPNIVMIHSVETADDIRFITMELVEGKPLADLIPAGGMTLERIFEVGIPLADALASAHQKGIIHRDLKPANVMVTDEGRLKVLDFGLAKLRHPPETPLTTGLPTEPLTGEGRVLGTMPYMSPEQLEGNELDGRSDVFSLGVMLYEMATGQRPFKGDTSVSLIMAIGRDVPAEVDTVRQELPHHMGRIIARCLEKDPEHRYQSVKDIRNEIAGLQREVDSAVASVASEAPEPPRPAQKRQGFGHGIWAALAVVLLLAGIWFWRGRDTAAPVVEPAPQPASSAELPAPSIAVLAFEDMSPDKDQEYFSDGLAEELLNLLANVEGLKVAARTSSFSFKGKDADIATIAEKLNVATVLEGSVRKAGGQVRITAQLVNAADGFHLWSQTYDRELDDIFAVQDEIALSVVEALEVTLLGEDSGSAPSRSDNTEAYNLYLQGKFFAERRRNAEDFERAIDLLEQAVALDPGYALGWAGLAYAHNNQASDGYVSVEEGHPKALNAIERALELDEDLAFAWAILGEIRTELEWDWNGAGEALTRARQLEPDNPDVIRKQAELANTLGKLEEATALAKRAVELDPLNRQALVILYFVYWDSGRLDEAESVVEMEAELGFSPDSTRLSKGLLKLARSRPQEALVDFEEISEPGRSYGLTLAYHDLGQVEESNAALEQFLKEKASFPYRIVRIHGYRGQADEAFELLERLFAQRDAYLRLMKTDPLLANLHDDPRWQPFLAKMNLAD